MKIVKLGHLYESTNLQEQHFLVTNLVLPSNLALWILPSRQNFGTMINFKYGALDSTIQPRPLFATKILLLVFWGRSQEVGIRAVRASHLT